ncbi:restriction endonuclease subunit S [Shewanella glacialipiscicola]|uniref:restriction endonuclease subunit S n=1 Tax=Shewanella glacialipiscicola TaxID=614069 RepID=UPI003D7B45FC
MSWPIVKLGELCNVVRGSSPRPKGDPRYYGGDIPRLMVSDVTRDGKYVTPRIDTLTIAGAEKSRPMKKGDFVIAVSGQPGQALILAIDACIHDGFAGLRDLDELKICKNYLFHFMNSVKVNFSAQAAGAIFKNLTTEQIRELQIPLPPLAEQKRIAAILDKADAIRRKRKQAIQLADDFLRSVFLDMFGDPVTNPKGFPIGSIRDFVETANYGSSGKASETEGEFPILRMGNITYEGGWNFSSLKYIDLSDKDKPKYLAQKGDLLFNRTNSKELVGKTAVFEEDIPMAIAGYLVRVRPNQLGNNYYLSGYLNSTHGKKILFGMCKSIVGMANINAQELQNIEIMLPPKKLQDDFESIVKSTNQKLKSFNTSEVLLSDSFNSLSQKAFAGKL